MNKWKTVRLGDIATYINGYAFKPSDWGTEGLPIIRIQNLTGNDYETNFFNGEIPQKYYVKNGDVLISWSASLGVYEWNNGTALLNQHIFKVVFNKIEVDKKYFIFTVANLLNEMAKQTHGSTMRHITKTDFDNMQFPLPSLKEQKHISELLEKCTTIIKTYKKMIEKYDTLIKSRFIEMFGDPLENSKHWETQNLGNLCEIVRGGSPRPIDKFLGGTIPWIKIGDATNGDDIYLYKTKEYIIEEGIKKSRLIPEGSLIFANCGVSLGFARIIKFQGCIHDGWLAFQNIDKNLNNVFLLKSLNMCTDYFRKTAPDGTQPNLNTSIMKSFVQILPPINLQNEYVHFVEQIDKSKFSINKSLENAKSLYKSLIQECFG